MDSSISNVGVKFEGALNMFKLQQLLEELIGDEDSAKKFLRIKGVFSIQGDNRMFVLQCVHMVQNQNFTRPWGDETRNNRIIFIGRGMAGRREELTEKVMGCVVGKLRFDVGAKVQCRMGETLYVPGTIIKHWDELNPYRIRLNDGG